MDDHPLGTAHAYLALGSNLDQPAQKIGQAVAIMASHPELTLIACSNPYRSAAIGFTEQEDFINAVIHVTTTLSAEQLLACALNTEQRLGRTRSFRNAPRTIDIDILLYNQDMCDSTLLTLPHPRMHERAFVLLPLLEIAPDAHIPGRGAANQFLAAVSVQRIERLPTPLCS